MKRIVCSAIKSDEGHIICAPRHFDNIMHQQIKNSGLHILNTWEQGFIDQRGVFYNRKDAYRIAYNAGQILEERDVTKNETLYSEMLY